MISMERKLRAILDILQELNLKTNIVAREEVEEQYDNLEDFKVLSNRLDEIPKKFKRINLQDGNEVNEMLAEIHVIMTTFEWHFSEISDLNSEIGREYKDKVNCNM